MSSPAEWRDLATPGHLFLALWRFVNTLRRETLAARTSVPETLADRLAAALALNDAAEAARAVCDALAADWTEAANWRANRLRAAMALTAMRAIDQNLLSIHPRAVRAAHGRTPLPDWLHDAAEARTLAGTFAAADTLSLIARGPLLRQPRFALEESTFVLGDQFAALMTCP